MITTAAYVALLTLLAWVRFRYLPRPRGRTVEHRAVHGFVLGAVRGALPFVSPWRRLLAG